MRIFSEEMLKGLEKNGASIDWSGKIAKIPAMYSEDCISSQKNAIKKGKKQILLNGGVSSKTGNKISCKFGSGAFYIYDWKNRRKFCPDEKDVAETIQFGNVLDDIGMIGIPVIPEFINGKKPSPHVLPILRAMLVAKNTGKVGNSEVNTPKQLRYLMEMGQVIKGSMKSFLEDPCFLTAKHPISPLQLDSSACEVLLALAKNGLPSNIVSMPILGTSVPVNLTGSIILTNAEIIGTLCAIKSICPEALVLGGVMPAVTDMRNGEISYDNPLAVKVDMAMAAMYDNFYEFDFGLGIYCSDAKFLGAEIILQRNIQLAATVLSGRMNPPIGLYDKGMVFSPELVLLEMDMLKNHAEMFGNRNLFEPGKNSEEITEILDAIDNVKPGGNFLTQDHTIKNFRKNFHSALLTEVVSLKEEKKAKGLFELASEKYELIKNDITPFMLSSDKEKEIDKIVKKACEDILNG
jgi:trimethylamine--corrinoid protein Co-methyltransferase